MKRKLILLGALVLPWLAGAQTRNPYVTVSPAQIAGTVAPGSNVVVTVTFTLHPQIYLHSNQVLSRNFYATTLRAPAVNGIAFLPPSYHGARPQAIPNTTGPQQVFSGSFTIRIPLTLAPNVRLPITIPASLDCQPVLAASHKPLARQQVAVPLVIQPSRITPPRK